MKESDLHILYLTKNCNLDCTYCYEKQDRGLEKMSIETIKSSIDFIMTNTPIGVRAKILLFGGEPLLHWQGCLTAMETIASYSRPASCAITTNGTLLKPERVKTMYQYKFMNIQVSIDGDSETHNKNRMFKSGIGSYDIIEKNVKYMLKYFPFAQARLVISDPDTMLNNIKHLVNIGFRDFCIQPLRFNDGRKYEHGYRDYFEKELNKVYDYINTLNLVRISDVQLPTTCDTENDMISRTNQTDALYKYFLPDGGKVFQKTYTPDAFQHFSEGENSSCNLLKNKPV